MVNKRGQTMGIAIASAIVIFILGMGIINIVRTEVTRTYTDLNCASATTISDSTKLLCLVTDSVVPYWILLVLSVALGGVVSRMKL